MSWINSGAVSSFEVTIYVLLSSQGPAGTAPNDTFNLCRQKDLIESGSISRQ
jgi:hypothetical protein